MMNIDLNGKVVLVTGASRGIGRAVAHATAAVGGQVAVHYNRSRAEAEAVAELHGSRLFRTDLSDMDAVRKLFADVVDAFGAVDVLVNNAGVALSIEAADTSERWESVWDTTMNVNLKAAALLSRLAVRHFIERGGGRIVTITSRAAFRGDTPDYMAYAASKGGLVSLTRSIARGFGKQGVRAFLVAPGFTRTDMAQDFIDAYGEDYALGDIALERLTEPSDVASIVVFLASGLADHATGCTIDVNAGSYVH